MVTAIVYATHIELRLSTMSVEALGRARGICSDQIKPTQPLLLLEPVSRSPITSGACSGSGSKLSFTLLGAAKVMELNPDRNTR